MQIVHSICVGLCERIWIEYLLLSSRNAVAQAVDHPLQLGITMLTAGMVARLTTVWPLSRWL